MLHTHDKNWIIPPGTQVVTLQKKQYKTTKGAFFKKRGSVGVVIKAPGDNKHPYLVRFPNGHEVNYNRNELVVRKREIEEKLHDLQCTTDELLKYKIYACLVGSRAYGLENSSSDQDIRGIYLPPARLHWSIFGVPEQLEITQSSRLKKEDAVYWEFEKFLRLALKANPNILEVLFTPIRIYVSPLAEELLEHRKIFLSKHIFKTYGGYVLSQFKRMEQDIRNRGEIRYKHACHCLRLLIAGCHALTTGDILVNVGDQRDLLLQIKHGDIPFPDIQQIVQEWEAQFNHAFEKTTLPDYPDFRKANEILLHARNAMVE
jgi:predicted nucleotidyltransferase